MTQLTPIQARVLACLIEKKETTPDQYPLSLNALRTACNQKSSREPVTAYTEGEVGHAIRELEGLGLATEEWGARVARWSHQAGKAWDLHSPGLALVATLMLRGPQTLGELRGNAHRLHAFGDLDDVHYALGKLIEREPPMVTALPRNPGQKEGRYAHLLCGEPALPPVTASRAPAPTAEPAHTDLSGRLETLESAVAELEARLAALEERANPTRSPR